MGLCRGPKAGSFLEAVVGVWGRAARGSGEKSGRSCRFFSKGFIGWFWEKVGLFFGGGGVGTMLLITLPGTPYRGTMACFLRIYDSCYSVTYSVSTLEYF